MKEKKHYITLTWTSFLLFFFLTPGFSQTKEKLNQFSLKAGVPDIRKVKFPNANFSSRLDFYYFNLNYIRRINFTEKIDFGASFSYSQSVIRTLFDLKDKTNILSISDQIALSLGVNLNYKISLKNRIDRIEVGLEYTHLILQENSFSSSSSAFNSNSNISSLSMSGSVEPKTTKSAVSLFFNYVKVRKKINYSFGLNPELVFPEKYRVQLTSTEHSFLGGKVDRKTIIDKSLRINIVFAVQI